MAAEENIQEAPEQQSAGTPSGDPIDKLYNVVKSKGWYTKSKDDFVKKYSDPAQREKLFNVVSSQGLYTNSKENFDKKYFPTDTNAAAGMLTPKPEVPKQGVASVKPVPSATGIPSIGEMTATAHQAELNKYKLNQYEAQNNIAKAYQTGGDKAIGSLIGQEKNRQSMLQGRENALIGGDISQANAQQRLQFQQQQPQTNPDLGAHPEEIEQYKELAKNNPQMVVKVLQHQAEKDPKKAPQIKADIYALRAGDRAGTNATQINKNIEAIKNGDLDYDIHSGLVTKPEGFWGSLGSGLTDRAKGVQDAAKFSTMSDKELADHLMAERAAFNPDEPVYTPEGTKGTVGKTLGDMGPMMATTTAVSSLVGNPELGALVGAAASSPEVAAVSYANAVKRNFNDLLAKGKTPEEAAAIARSQAKGEMAVDVATNMAATYTGTKLGKAALPELSGSFKNIVGGLAKQALTTGKAGIKEGALMAAIFGEGEQIKNDISGRKGAEGIGEAMKGGFIIPLAIGGLHQAGKLGLKAIDKLNLKQGLLKFSKEQVDSELGQMVQNGQVPAEDAVQIGKEVDAQRELDSKIPASVKNDAVRLEIQKKLESKAKLEERLKTEDKAFHEPAKKRIEQIDEEIRELASSKEAKEKDTEPAKPEEETEEGGVVPESKPEISSPEKIEPDATPLRTNEGAVPEEGQVSAGGEVDRSSNVQQDQVNAPEHGKTVEQAGEKVTEPRKRYTKPEDFEADLAKMFEEPVRTEAKPEGESLPKMGEAAPERAVEPVTRPNTGKEALDQMEEHYKDDPAMQRTIKFLRDTVGDVKIIHDFDFAKEAADNGRSQEAQALHLGEKGIAMNWKAHTSPEHASNTLAHEMIHEVTRKGIDESAPLRDELNDILSIVREKMGVPDNEGLIKAMQSRGYFLDHKYGASNPHELLAEVFTNKDFQSALKDMEYKGDNLLKKFIEAIAKFISSNYAKLHEAKANIDAKDIAEHLQQLTENYFKGEQKGGGDESLAQASVSPERRIEAMVRNSDLSEEQMHPIIKKITGWDDARITDVFNKAKEPQQTALTHADINKQREAEGQAPLTDMTKSEAERAADVQSLKVAGANVQEIIDRLNKGGSATTAEVGLLHDYLSGLDGKVRNLDPSSKEYGEVAAEKERAQNAYAFSTSSAGATLKAAQKIMFNEESALDQINARKNAYGVDALTPEQQAKIVEQTKRLEAQNKAFREYIEKLEAEKFEAEVARQKAIEEKKNKQRPAQRSKKTHEDFVAERKSIMEDLRRRRQEAKGNLYAIPFPYANELIAIAPAVAKLVKSLVEEGITKLDDVVSHIHGELSKDIEGLTERDVRDLVAGKYNRPRTRNEISNQVADVRKTQQLLDKIEAFQNKPEPKTEKERVVRNQEHKVLNDQLKELKKIAHLKDTLENIGVEKPVREKPVDSPEAADLKQQIADKRAELRDENKQTPLEAAKKRLERSLASAKDELEAIKRGETPEKKQPQKIELDEKGKELKAQILATRREIATENAAAEYARRSKFDKFMDKTYQILGLRRIITTAFDWSIPFRQANPVTMNPIHWGKVGTAFKEMAKSTFSQKHLNSLMDDIKEQPEGRYDEQLKDGIKYSEPDELNIDKREEEFAYNMMLHNPILKNTVGLGTRASERAAAAYLNVLRNRLYNQYRTNLENSGKTRESHPEAYTAMAKWVMNITGRGNLLKALENNPSASKLANSVFFGTRLMASRFNLLNPVYYARMPKGVRGQAMKDMAAHATTLMATGLALKAAGADVDLDFDSPDFLKVKFGDTRYEIAGGMTPYVRTFLRLSLAAIKTATRDSSDPDDMKTSQKYNDRAAKAGLNFFRNKLSPNTAYVVDAIAGTNSLGQPFDPYNIIRIYPMYIDDIRQAWGEQGPASLATILIPSFLGIGVQNYQTANPKEKKAAEKKKRAEARKKAHKYEMLHGKKKPATTGD